MKSPESPDTPWLNDAEPDAPRPVCGCRDLLTLAEAAARLGIAESGVLRLRRPAAVRIKQARLVFWSDVEAWARDRTARPCR